MLRTIKQMHGGVRDDATLIVADLTPADLPFPQLCQNNGLMRTLASKGSGFTTKGSGLTSNGSGFSAKSTGSSRGGGCFCMSGCGPVCTGCCCRACAVQVSACCKFTFASVIRCSSTGHKGSLCSTS